MDFEDEGGYEMDRDGNYLQTRKAFRMSKKNPGSNYSQSNTNMYNKIQVQRQLEQKLESEVTNLSILEDQLNSLLFNRNVGGQFKGNSIKSRKEQQKERKKIQEMYENMNFFDETEKKKKYIQKRKKDKSIQDQYAIISSYVKDKLKSVQIQISEDIEEQFERYALIISKLNAKTKKQIKSSLCMALNTKLTALEDLKKVHDEVKDDSYYTQIQNQLNKEKKAKLKQEIV